MHRVQPVAFKFILRFFTIRYLRTSILVSISLKLAFSRWALLGGIFLEFGCLLHAAITLYKVESQAPVESLRIITIVVLSAMHGF